jgi:hypothetical protein
MRMPEYNEMRLQPDIETSKTAPLSLTLPTVMRLPVSTL